MSLKARYKLNGNVNEIQGLISGKINDIGIDIAYRRTYQNQISNVNIIKNSNYFSFIENGYLVIYDYNGNFIWHTKETYINKYNVEIEEKKYNNIKNVYTNNNTIYILFVGANNALYCDAYNIFGEKKVNSKPITGNISDVINFCSYCSNSLYYVCEYFENRWSDYDSSEKWNTYSIDNEDWLSISPLIVDEIKDYNKIKEIDIYGNYRTIDIDVSRNIKQPYYIKGITNDENYWYILLIDDNNKTYIQKNSIKGSYISHKEITNNITIYDLINTDDRIGIICNDTIYTIDKSLSEPNFSIGKKFDGSIKQIKTNEKTEQITVLYDKDYSGIIGKLDTEIAIIDYDYSLISISSNIYEVNNMCIDNEEYIYTVMSSNILTKYKPSIKFTDGVIADKCAEFSGGRIEIENPFYDKINDKPIDLTDTGLSISLWYKPNTFDWKEQIIMGGITMPKWKCLTYSSYWNKYFMLSEDTNMLAVGSYEEGNLSLVWRAYNIFNNKYKLESFRWIPEIRRFIAIGKESNCYMLSENGLEWTEYKLDESFIFNKIKYIKELNKTFIVGNNGLIVSLTNISLNDDVTIEYVQNAPKINITDIEYNDNRYYIISDETNSIYYIEYSDFLNGEWLSSKTDSSYKFISIDKGKKRELYTDGTYKDTNLVIAVPNEGSYVYQIKNDNIAVNKLKLPQRYDEIKKVKVINDKFYIITNETYCLTFDDLDGSWNTTDIIFDDERRLYSCRDITVGNVFEHFDPSGTGEWKEPIRRITIGIPEDANYILASYNIKQMVYRWLDFDSNEKWEDYVTKNWLTAEPIDKEIPIKSNKFERTYFLNGNSLNIWANYGSDWTSYGLANWNTLYTSEKNVNLITDLLLKIDEKRNLCVIYDDQIFVSNFIFDGSKLNNWYNFIITIDKTDIVLYVNGEEYNRFKYKLNDKLKIYSKTITLGDINKHKDYVKGIEIWNEFKKEWNNTKYNSLSWATISSPSVIDYNYYNLYGSINDIRFYDEILSANDIHKISQINVGNYNGIITTTTLPSDNSEFNNNLKTDKLFCLNKDWSLTFKYKNIEEIEVYRWLDFDTNEKWSDYVTKDWTTITSINPGQKLLLKNKDKLILNKSDEYGGFMIGYFNGIELERARWRNVIRQWKDILETWHNLKPDIKDYLSARWFNVLKQWKDISNDWLNMSPDDPEFKYNIYLVIFDKRNNMDFRTKKLIPDGYTENDEHSYGITYNHNDRMVKLYFKVNDTDNYKVFDRMFNLEYRNTEIPIEVTDSNIINKLSDLKIYHSCLSEKYIK